MVDWVHCNVCYSQPCAGRQFLLTNCGHIICSRCLPEGVCNTCSVCNSSCSTVKLTAKMKPEIEILFTDPTEIIKKHEQQLLRVMEFQKNHRKRLTPYYKEKMSQAQAAVVQTQELEKAMSKQSEFLSRAQMAMEQMKELEKENQILKAENHYLKNIITKMESAQRRVPSPSAALRNAIGSSLPCASSGSTMRRPNCNRSPFQDMQMTVVHAAGSGDDKLMPSQTKQGFSHASPSPHLTPFGTPMNRISVRTPPSNGRIGIIPQYQSTPAPDSMAAPSSSSHSHGTPHISNFITAPLTPVCSRPSNAMNYTPSFTTPQQHCKQLNLAAAKSLLNEC